MSGREATLYPPGQQMKHYSVSAIIPVGLNEARAVFCLEHFSRLSPPVDEVVLVCDGANESARRAAAAFGARLVELPTRLGPACARNQGAFAAGSDVLLFVDADVLVPSDVVNKVLQVLDAESGLAACFGSYDDAPGETNFLSQYKNLFHHYVHQNSPAEASTFWTGCGAIFRDVFEELGGFNEAFGLPSVEDIEFGYRLRDAGYRIRLVHSLQVKHLKRWEASLLIRTDFLRRAIPWGRLVLNRTSIPRELNLQLSGRVSGLAAVVLAGSVPILALDWQAGLALALVAVTCLVLLNFPLYRFFMRKRGLMFMSGALLWNWLYYLYGSAGFGVALVQHFFARWKRSASHSDEKERIGAQLPLE